MMSRRARHRVGRRAVVLGAAASAFSVLMARTVLADEGEDEAPRDALTPVRNRYASLTSYADRGSVLVEQSWDGGGLRESGTFTTFYRAPRQFFFEFVQDGASGSDRFVIWCDGGDFQSWWATTGEHEIYDGGRGASAFFNGEYPTYGTAMAVPGLLFARAELGGPVAGLTDIRQAGEEMLEGRGFDRIAADTLVAGGVVRAHPTTLLVDRETLLVHRLVEDTPPGVAGLQRRTMTFAPQADIEVDEARFSFVVPG